MVGDPVRGDRWPRPESDRLPTRFRSVTDGPDPVTLWRAGELGGALGRPRCAVRSTTAVAAGGAGGAAGRLRRAGGVDGDLTDDWAALPASRRRSRPAAGVCHAGRRPREVAAGQRTSRSTAPARTGPRPCTSARSPADAGRTRRRRGLAGVPGAPSPSATGRRPGTSATTGGPAGCGSTSALPDRAGWAGGRPLVPLRPDRADQASSRRRTVVGPRTGSLRDALKGPAPLRLGCYTGPRGSRPGGRDDDPGRLRQAAQRRVRRGLARRRRPGRTRAEDARLGAASTTAAAASSPATSACRTTRTLRLPQRRGGRARRAAARWQAGDRGVRCYLWLSDRTVHRARCKGAGPAGLPVRTK